MNEWEPPVPRALRAAQHADSLLESQKHPGRPPKKVGSSAGHHSALCPEAGQTWVGAR